MPPRAHVGMLSYRVFPSWGVVDISSIVIAVIVIRRKVGCIIERRTILLLSSFVKETIGPGISSIGGRHDNGGTSRFGNVNKVECS